MPRIGNLIGGKSVATTSGRSVPVFNPATGEQNGELGLSSTADVDVAVQAAKRAFPAWAATAPLKRARYMFKFKELLEANADKVAQAISAEHGKTHSDALGEVQRGLEVVEFACGIPHLLAGEFSRNVGPAIDTYNDRQPLGVVAGITPFNFPAMVPLWMYPVAIACWQLLSSSSRRSAIPQRRPAGRKPPERSRAAGGRASTSSMATRRRSTRCSIIPTSRRSASSARPRSRSTSMRPPPPTASAARRWAAPRTTWW